MAVLDKKKEKGSLFNDFFICIGKCFGLCFSPSHIYMVSHGKWITVFVNKSMFIMSTGSKSLSIVFPFLSFLLSLCWMFCFDGSQESWFGLSSLGWQFWGNWIPKTKTHKKTYYALVYQEIAGDWVLVLKSPLVLPEQGKQFGRKICVLSSISKTHFEGTKTEKD